VKIYTNQKRKRCQQGAKQRINNSLNTPRIIPQPQTKKQTRFGSIYPQRRQKDGKLILPQVKYNIKTTKTGKTIRSENGLSN
jgi:hypothetical protein